MIYGKAGQESTRLRGAKIGDLDKIQLNIYSARSQSANSINKASQNIWSKMEWIMYAKSSGSAMII